jgi:YVTN family beta-propeller protein
MDTLRVGDYPKSVSISPDQKSAYVCNLEQGSIDILDTSTGKRKKRLLFHRTPLDVTIKDHVISSFEEKPVEIGFTEGGRYVWISLLNSGGIVIYDTANEPISKEEPARVVDVLNAHDRVVGTRRLRFVKTGRQPKIIAVTPDERQVLVANWKGFSVSVIDAVTFQKIKNIEVGSLPRGICFTKSSAFVANFGSNTISEIDLPSLRVKRTFRHVGKNPRHLVPAPDENSLYVSNHGDAYIRQVDVVSGQTIRSCSVGNEPRTIALSRKKNFLFVANYADDTLAVVDLKSMSRISTIKTVARPIGISVDSRSDTVWVTGYWAKSVRRYRFDSKLGSVQPAVGHPSYKTASKQL